MAIRYLGVFLVVLFLSNLGTGFIGTAVSENASQQTCAVDLEVDASHSTLLLDILDDGQVSDEEATTFLAHPGTIAGMQKTLSYGLDVTDELLVAQIRQLTTDEPVTDRTFALHRYKERQNSTQTFISDLQENLTSIMAEICARIDPYVPMGSRFKQKIVVVSAVNSTGFATNDAGSFYIVAEAFNGDLPGAGDIIVHESYHAIQSALAEGNERFGTALAQTPSEEKALQLMASTITEGTATHLADPIAAGNEGAMRRFQYNLARRYVRNIQHQFVLFDTTLFRAFHDPDVEYGPLHRIGLEGNEGFYHMGALMSKALAEADGTMAIPEYLQKSPVEFFARYIEIADASNGVYPSFSSSTRNIVAALKNSSSSNK